MERKVKKTTKKRKNIGSMSIDVEVREIVGGIG
jgi:hypothetical protein